MNSAFTDIIKRTLEEDGAYYDITTLSTVPGTQQAQAAIIARRAGVIAGLEVAAQAFTLFDARITVTLLVQDGATVKPDERLATISGPARSILSAERTALNFLGHLSGIATLTAHCVSAIEGTGAHILDTRKTMPGLRMLEKQAVRLGGGQNHRFGLDDGILIKDNHIKAAGGITQAVEAARRMAPHLFKVEVECETLEQVQEALEARADVIMLDNMSVEVMQAAVTSIREQNPQVLIEASGSIGTDEKRLKAVASTGVDFISLGAITHSAPQFDISLEFA
uniref:Probable nicotinate-nucleotide pyrophosphorylase [carboxylating] n=1 Tax=Thermosporothrix sp. COM3 TaxID=2490863 RepID=A0A455STQ7_9CHLR|nr:nicotinate-nucleotide diphosphorylase [Thermosporothrix sp. COM3]